MPGYSGTPLPKKLGIKDNLRLLLLHAPENVKAELSDAIAKCQALKKATGDVDFALLFCEVSGWLGKRTTGCSPLTSSGRHVVDCMAKEKFGCDKRSG